MHSAAGGTSQQLSTEAHTENRHTSGQGVLEHGDLGREPWSGGLIHRTRERTQRQDAVEGLKWFLRLTRLKSAPGVDHQTRFDEGRSQVVEGVIEVVLDHQKTWRGHGERIGRFQRNVDRQGIPACGL
jgi:hypothetical protein